MSGGYLFNKRPVIQVGTGDLYDGHTKLHTHIHRLLVKGCGHGYARDIAYGLDQDSVAFPTHAGGLGLGNIAVSFRTLAFRVNKAIHITELKFDCRFYAVVTGDCSVILNDLQSPFHTPPMIIGKLKDKKILEQLIPLKSIHCVPHTYG